MPQGTSYICAMDEVNRQFFAQISVEFVKKHNYKVCYFHDADAGPAVSIHRWVSRCQSRRANA